MIKNFTNFKFESNIFIQIMKKNFYSKFGIYNKKSIQILQICIHVSGNFDLDEKYEI